MMKHLLAILFLSLFTYVQVFNSVVWVNYEWNIDEITEAFCINKNAPELNCHGSCHLKKQLIQTDTEPVKESQGRISYVESLVSFVLHPSTSTPKPEEISVVHYSPFISHSVKKKSYSIFHPPKV